MSHIELQIFATLALGAGPVLFLRSFRELRLRRLIQNTPTARIRSMAMGLAEIHGTAAARSTVFAPFSGRSCAFWAVDIAVRRRRSGWAVVHRNASGQPFYVEDGTGAALVYPQGADSKVRVTSEEQCMGLTVPDCYASYMSSHKLHFRHLWRLGVMRFRERVLEEGEPVYVLGTAEPRPQAITLSDGEWMESTGTDGPLGPSRPVRHERQHAAVIRRGTHEPAFVISQDSERALVFVMGITALAKLVAGPILTLVGMWIWGMALTSGRVFR
jgi:hypothetical protein